MQLCIPSENLDHNYNHNQCSLLIKGHSPVLNIRHSDNDLAIYSRLKKEAADKYDVYIKNDLPGNFFYVNNDRVGAITLVAKEAFAFYDIYKDWKKLNSEHKRAEYLDNVYGVAGYDNTLDSMQSIVIMQGPGVRQIQVIVTQITNI